MVGAGERAFGAAANGGALRCASRLTGFAGAAGGGVGGVVDFEGGAVHLDHAVAEQGGFENFDVVGVAGEPPGDFRRGRRP